MTQVSFITPHGVLKAPKPGHPANVSRWAVPPSPGDEVHLYDMLRQSGVPHPGALEPAPYVVKSRLWTSPDAVIVRVEEAADAS